MSGSIDRYIQVFIFRFIYVQHIYTQCSHCIQSSWLASIYVDREAEIDLTRIRANDIYSTLTIHACIHARMYTDNEGEKTKDENESPVLLGAA